ncbi:MAG: ATP-binding protein [Pseudomonadota bacterium]
MVTGRESKFGALAAATYVAVWALILLIAGQVFFPRLEETYIERAQQEGASTLRLVAGAVDQAVGRYQPLPTLIAGDPIFLDLLRETGNAGLVPFVNEKLRQTSLSIGASEVYIMDRAGLTVASSNYREPDSFVGRNFSFRPYFYRALAGEVAQFHALGTTSGERGFFFAAPVLDGIEVAGVLAVKVTVGEIEQAWEGAGREIIVADENGVAFLASREAYRLRTLAPLTDGTLARISETRQFPLGTVTPMPFSASVIAAGAVKVELGLGGDEVSYLSQSEPLTLAGWHAIVLTPLSEVRSQAVSALVFWTLAATATALAFLVLLQRRARLLERMEDEASQRQLLERKVRERTADLDDANASLRSEVAERRSAEDLLRKTQKDLVQAGKLAALGQMSAALSHEINQPLAAVKSYADNAAQYLKRDRMDAVGANIARISEMADRMADISRHLRNFARRPGDALKAVPVVEVIHDVIALVDPQLRSSGAVVVFEPPQEEIFAIGGRLRLQQVLVNIVTNALDAMADGPNRIIEIAVAARETTLAITLRDHGPGLPPDALDQVFEAFYTTKEAGSGMGLGMSISYNIVEDFGGALSAENHPDGGAVFTVDLQRAQGAGQLVAE